MSTVHPTPRFGLYAGVDIAAETFTAAWMAPCPNATPGRAATFDQTLQGFARLQERLCAFGRQPADILVVMEARGCYWIALATTLAQAGFVVSVVHPAQAHHVAKALLRQAKTDAIDARTPMQGAALLQPALRDASASGLRGTPAAPRAARHTRRAAAAGPQPTARAHTPARRDRGGPRTQGGPHRDPRCADRDGRRGDRGSHPPG